MAKNLMPTAPATPKIEGHADGASPTTNTPKNFRHHPDIENFFRFIYENDLREEALELIDTSIVKKAEIKLAKKQARI